MIVMRAIMDSTFASGTACAGPTTGSATLRRRTAGRVATAVGALLAPLFIGVALGGAMPVAELEVDIAGLRSTHGLLRLCVTANPAKFPSCVGDPRALSRSVPATESTIALGPLPRGDWAVAVIHDANSNGKLDTVMGVPREGFGFSRNPSIGFGAPKFDAARFPLQGDTVEKVKLRYLL